MTGRLQLLVLLCIAGCAPHGAHDLIAPHTTGSVLPGGYRVASLQPEGRGWIHVALEGEAGTVHVRFFHRTGGSPAFARTTNCDVLFEADGLPSGSPTPGNLARSVQALTDAASHKDGICSSLEPSSVLVSAGPSSSRPFPWPAALAALAGLVALGLFLGLASRRVPDRWQEAGFWTAVAAFTALGAILRLGDLGAPFCESASTQRVELALSPLWELLTMQARDFRHPPMAALVLKAALGVGREEWILRLPFVLASSLSLPLVALLGRRLADRSAGAAACLACAALGPLVSEGHQVGAHALYFLTAPAVLLALLWMVERPDRRGCILLAAVNAAALWSSYLAVFLVAPQVVLLARRRTRRHMGAALALTAVLGALPLLNLARGFVQDMGVRQVARRVPEAAWGDVSAWDVLAQAVGQAGAVFAIAAAALAVAGSILLVRPRAATDRPTTIAILASVWIAPIVILVLTPLVRVRGTYLIVVLPLVVVLAAAGASLLASWAAGRYGMGGAACSGLAGGLLGLLVVASLAPALSSGPASLAYREQPCSYHVASRLIDASNVRTVVLVHGHSRTLLGYYLAAPGSRTLGTTGIKSLCHTRSLGPRWRQEAEDRLRLMAAEGPLWLVDVTHVERTWPALESAGGCRPQRVLGDLRLLVCGEGN